MCTNIRRGVGSSSSAVGGVFLSTVRAKHGCGLRCGGGDVPTPFKLGLGFRVCGGAIFGLLGQILKVRHNHFFPITNTPLSSAIGRFLRSIGVPVICNCNLDRAATAIYFCPRVKFRFNSVKRIVPSMRMQVSPRGDRVLMGNGAIVSNCCGGPTRGRGTFARSNCFHAKSTKEVRKGALFFARHVGSLCGASGNGCVTPRTVRVIVDNSRCVRRVTIVNSRHGFIDTLVIPTCPLLRGCTRRGKLTINDQRRLIQGGRVLHLVRARVRRGRGGLTSCRGVGHFALLSRPFAVKSRLASALGLHHSIVLGGCTSPVRGVCRRTSGV